MSLLCMMGLHCSRFVSNYQPVHDERLPMAGLWVCQRCGHKHMQWYIWSSSDDQKFRQLTQEAK